MPTYLVPRICLAQRQMLKKMPKCWHEGKRINNREKAQRKCKCVFPSGRSQSETVTSSRIPVTGRSRKDADSRKVSGLKLGEGGVMNRQGTENF